MTRIEKLLPIEHRATIAAQAMCALIMSRRKYDTKKHLCDNAIAYADMLVRRLAEIPIDAQQRAEHGSKQYEINNHPSVVE